MGCGVDGECGHAKCVVPTSNDQGVMQGCRHLWLEAWCLEVWVGQDPPEGNAHRREKLTKCLRTGLCLLCKIYLLSMAAFVQQG